MKLHRRKFLQLTAAGITAPAFPFAAMAEDYPTRPVRIIAGFAAGGGVDITARLIGEWLSERLGQSFVTRKRAGARGQNWTHAGVESAPDGDKLVLAPHPETGKPTRFAKAQF